MNTKNYFFPVLLSCLTIAQCDQEMENLIYYDKFGEPTSLVHTSGYVTFYCDGRCDGINEIMLIDPDGNVIRSDKCTSKSPTWQLDFDANFKMGAYGCRFKSNDGPKIDFKYRICDDQNQTCAEEEGCTDPGKYCFITKDGPLPCSKIPDSSWCNVHVPESNIYTFCPIDDQSLCGGIYKDYMRTWALLEEACLPDHTVPRLYYQSRPYVYYEPIHIYATDRRFTVTYSNNVEFDNSNFTCVIKHREINAPVIETLYAKVLHSATVTFPDTIFNRGSRTFNFRCSFYKAKERFGDGPRAMLFNILVVIGGILTVTSAQDDASLTCQLNPLPGPEFRVLYWWTIKGSSVLHSGSSIVIRQANEYQCHASIVFKTCNPHRKFEQALHSDPFLVNSIPISVTADNPSPENSRPSPGLSPVTAISSPCAICTCKLGSTGVLNREPLFALINFYGYTLCAVVTLIIM